jgi:hypothetical protein
MKTARAIAAAVAVAIAALMLAPPASATTVPAVCATATFTTTVTDRPDSGLHGDWAKDTFTRTTTVVCLGDGQFRMDVVDSGHFTTLPNALSPNAGLPIGPPITGDFSGKASATVKWAGGALKDPTAGASGKFSTSEWIGLVFGVEAKGSLTAWAWTYKHCTEKWVNANTGNSGDITGKKCHVPPTSTSPAPTTKPTVTTTAPAPTTTTTSTSKPVVVVTNPGQFQTVPNVSKGVNTGDGSLS